MTTTAERIRRYEAFGMTPRLARKKAAIIAAYVRARERGDRRAISKWTHANTKMDTTRVNGEWTMCGEEPDIR